MKIEDSSGNIYADIGMANPEEMLRKARFVEQISEVITCSEGRISWAASIIGLSETRLKEVLRGHFQDYKDVDLIKYLEKLRQNESFAGAKLGEWELNPAIISILRRSSYNYTK